MRDGLNLSQGPSKDELKDQADALLQALWEFRKEAEYDQSTEFPCK